MSEREYPENIKIINDKFFYCTDDLIYKGNKSEIYKGRYMTEYKITSNNSYDTSFSICVKKEPPYLKFPELETEYAFHAVYEASELGQINLNASIAEHLGFSIDSKTVNRQAERLEEDGSLVVETVPIRKTAYYLPKRIRNILNGDNDLLAYARARKKTLLGEEDTPSFVDIFQGAWKKYGYIISIKLVYSNEIVYTFARGMDWKSRWLGVSKENPAPTGEFVDTIEKYSSLKEAENSKYYLGLKVAEQLLGAVFFGTVKPEDVQLDDLKV